MGSFTIWARVSSGDTGGFTATACAVPVERSELADVRTNACDSHQEAINLLDPMARRLALELSSRGDQVLSIEFP